MHLLKLYDDPRPLLLLTIVCGITVWWLSPLYLCIISFCLLNCLYSPLFNQSIHKKPTLYYHAIFFVCSWCMIKFIIDSLTMPISCYELLTNTVILGLRLCVLILLGLYLISKTTPRHIALAAGWYLRPFFKQHTWEITLALSLMFHTIPRLFHTVSQIQATTRHSLSLLSRLQHIQVIMSTTTRILIMSISKQSTVIIAKHLASPEPWELNHPPKTYSMFIAIAISCCLIYLSILS